jgi:hypothetical protein
MIDEFMASNDGTILDQDGDKSDWIELYNASAATVNLGGWALTDNSSKPQKWVFPSVSLPKGGYLLIFASSKNRTNAATQLHTNFKLGSGSGGYLALVDPTTNVVSVFANYPEQLPDISYGADISNPVTTGYYVKPTPGSANSTLGAGISPTVRFSQPSKTYTGTLTLTLSTVSPNAVIRYTTDGSLPTDISTTYTAPLALTTAVQIRAQSFLPTFLPSAPHSEMYIPLSSQIANFTSDLPVMIVHDFGQGSPPQYSDTPAFVQVFERGTNALTTLTNAPTASSRAVISARGSSTLFYPKISMKLEFHDELEGGRNIPLLGLPTGSDWVLYAPNNYEPILIHNPFAHQLSRDIGRYSPRTRFVEVYLVQNGNGPVSQADYNGIYVLEEKIKFDSERIDQPKLNPGQNTAPEVTGGYILKVDRAGPGESGFGSGHQQIVFDSPKEFDIIQPDRAGQYAYITDYMRKLDASLYAANFRDPTNGYRAYIAAPSWIDHHLLNVLTFNVDALRLSAYFYKERDGKVHFGPLWDFDRALDSTDGRDSNPRVWRSETQDRGTDFFNYTWWNRLFRDPDFYQDYVDRYQTLRLKEFSTTNLWRLVDDLTSQVRKAQPREQARWGVSPRGSYQGEINILKTWLSNRTAFIDSQYVSPVTFATPGQTVSNGFALVINAPTNATVYYTLDDTDPRQLGTQYGFEFKTNAIEYTGPIILTNNARVFARARDPVHPALAGANNPPLKSIWSRPTIETYVVNPIPLLVTELMYHPVGDGNNTTYNAKDFEFLELKNTGSAPISLPGFNLGGTISFAFAATNAITTLSPGARAVLVSDAAAFHSRYPNVTNVIGEYQGSMGNSTGHITLTGRLLEPVLDFDYSAAWRTNTDGGGFSLVLASESISPAALGNGTNWVSSTNLGGSPGQTDPATSLPIKLSFVNDLGTGFLRFAGAAGKKYTVQMRSVLGDGPWQTYRVLTTPASEVNEVSISFGQTANFFRVTTD